FSRGQDDLRLTRVFVFRASFVHFSRSDDCVGCPGIQLYRRWFAREARSATTAAMMADSIIPRPEAKPWRCEQEKRTSESALKVVILKGLLITKPHQRAATRRSNRCQHGFVTRKTEAQHAKSLRLQRLKRWRLL